MIYKKLYVIGNGFDLHHDINSSYRDFKTFTKQNNPNFFNKIEIYFEDSDKLWSSFEIGLANLNRDCIFDDWRILNPEWNQSYKAMYRFVDDVGNDIEDLRYQITDLFKNWVKSLKSACCCKKLSLESTDAFFINFNYTNTLEYLYQINPTNILYIHGDASNPTHDLIFGHHLDHLAISEKIWSEDSLEDEALEHIRSYYIHFRKPVENIIKKNKGVFEFLKNVNEVYILGLSLSIVDFPYIQEIYNSVSKDAKWIVSYHNANDASNANQTFSKLNITLPRYKLLKLENLSSEFLPKLF